MEPKQNLIQQEDTLVPQPRVSFAEPEFDRGGEALEEELEPRFVVASPKKQVVMPQVLLKPILKAPKHVVASQTIASRVKACQTQQGNPPEKSIAERVARQQREATNTVLDHKTGELLEY